MTTKEVTKKQTNAIAEYQPATDLLDMAPTLSQDHLRLKKLKIHQGTTKGRKGMIGEVYVTPEMDKVVGPEERLTFYAITYRLAWYHNIKGPNDQQPKPCGITPWRNANQYTWKEETTEGIKQNYQTATVFCVLEKDLESGSPTPIQIVLSATNFSAAALPLMNRYEELKRFKKEPWLMKFTLKTEESKKGAWHVFKIEPVVGKNGHEMASPEHFETLRGWTRTLLEAQRAGDLNATADDLAGDVHEQDAQPTHTTAPRTAAGKLDESQLQY